MKNSLDILREAYDLIRDPSRWTRRALARDAHGEGMNYSDPRATQWCAVGAVLKISLDHGIPDGNALHELNQVVDGGSIVMANNGADGHAEICRAFRAAIAKLETPDAPRTVPF